MQRYLRIFFVIVISIFAPAFVLSVYLEPPTGDLTRIGNFSERDFGWNEKQPRVEIKRNGGINSYSDILVLGDSFSEKNIWQSVLADQTNLKLLTYQYSDLGCWVDLAVAHPDARLVIIETIERSFVTRFKEIHPCRKKSQIPVNVEKGQSSVERVSWPPTIRIKQTFATAYSMLVDKYVNKSERVQVRNSQIVDRCAKFSNRLSSRLLYFSGDEEKSQWVEGDIMAAVNNVKELQARFEKNGKSMVFVLVPDKLSIYGDCISNPTKVTSSALRVGLVERIARAGIVSPDLTKAFVSKRAEISDLYLPNDTHFGTKGYMLLADLLRDFVLRK